MHLIITLLVFKLVTLVTATKELLYKVKRLSPNENVTILETHRYVACEEDCIALCALNHRCGDVLIEQWNVDWISCNLLAKTGSGDHQRHYIYNLEYHSCQDLLDAGYQEDTDYQISVVDPDTNRDTKVKVRCDMSTDGGGWLVFHRRHSGNVDFYRGWHDFKQGFGQVTESGEFWLGNKWIHALTSAGPMELRVELQDWDNNQAYAKYEEFSIGPESEEYPLGVSGYSGNAGDALHKFKRMKFSTFDNDNDGKAADNCARYNRAAWWIYACNRSNLNGVYRGEGTHLKKGMNWYTWKDNSYSLKSAEMKIRPKV